MTAMTSHPAPDARLVGDALEHWARVTPDAEALRYGDQSWTWAQWRDRVHRATGMLRGLSVRRGDVVAFVDRNHPACLEITFAAAALGAANAVVNWRLSTEELAYVLDDCAPMVVFAGDEQAASIAAVEERLGGLHRVVVVGGPADEYEPLLAAAAPVSGDPEVKATDPALVIYTSGTTGFPKGVLLTHRGLTAHARALADVFPPRPGDRNLVAMPLFHVGGSCYALLGVHLGMPTTLARDATPANLFPALAGVSHGFFVPAVIAGVLAAGETAVAAFRGLRFISYGAAPMPAPTVRAAMDAWPTAEFLQVYGMTELSGATVYLDDAAHRDPLHPSRLASAGRPMTGVELRVVDPVTLVDVVPGASGELWFRGDQVMAGYLGRPDATAETITPDGWLRSGDVGYVDSGGFMYVSDRVKDMIITGGENVYCPEVERVLAEHPGLADVAVIGIPDELWGESVKAVVVAAPDATVDEADVIAFCRERLAHFKCPRSVDVVDALPRNATGKILKRDLRAPHWAGRDRQV